MIKSFFIWFFLLISVVSKAQQYEPLVVDSAHYIIEDCDAINLPPSGTAIEYMILGDTVVASNTYKKVYRRGWQYGFCNLGQPSSSFQLFSLIREDTITRRVYSTGGGSGCPAGNDTFMYDFNLGVGDTIYSCLFLSPKTVSTITSSNPWLASKEYTLNGNLKLFEGVGSEFGLFEIIETNVSTFSQPVLTHYCRDGNSCGLVSIEDEIDFSSEIDIYPVPSKNLLNIDFKNKNENLNYLEILSLDGRLIARYNLNSRRNNLNVDFISPGFYILKITTDNKCKYRNWIRTE